MGGYIRIHWEGHKEERAKERGVRGGGAVKFSDNYFPINQT